MPIDELDELNEFPPRKWLDKKRYVRVDSLTGLPQLVRVEPILVDNELISSEVTVSLDDESPLVMDREAAEVWLHSMNCVPLEVTAQWKNFWIH
jgi:hypothetical protein